MVASKGPRPEMHEGPAGRVRVRGTAGTLAFLRRIGTYLWIGLVNPGPPASTPRHTGSRS